MRRLSSEPQVGHHRTRCAPGVCAAEVASGTSKLERDLFSILAMVLGDGQRDYHHDVPGVGVKRYDMAFPLTVDDVLHQQELILVVEYDGAYWHEGREQEDRRKAESITRRCRWPRHEVVRVREEPLKRLRGNDVRVPRNADALTSARLTLLHIAHRIFSNFFGEETRTRIEYFLASGATPLTLAQVHCKDCRGLHSALRDVTRYPYSLSREAEARAARRAATISNAR